MAWTNTARWLQDHGSLFAPVFLLAGILIITVLPFTSTMRYTIDENAIGSFSPSVNVRYGRDRVVHWDRRLVRGTRSPGSDVIAVYVNTDHSNAVLVGNSLIDSLERNSNLSTDVLFFFVAGSKPWPLPNSAVRSALVINVSQVEFESICVDTQGEDGTRPNQDLLNLAVTLMQQDHLRPCYLCHVAADGGVTLSPLAHALLDMKQSVRTSLHPQPWHTFGTRGVSTIAFSSPSKRTGRSMSGYEYVHFLQKMITTLSGLDERFHHSTFMWFGSKTSSYLQYDILQFSTILFVASIVATSYSVYQRHGVSISPLPVALWVLACATQAATNTYGLPGMLPVSIIGIAALSLVPRQLAHIAFWMTINAVALCLMVLLHPAVGLLVGGGTALQMLVLHDRLRSPLLKCVGALVAWGVVYAVCVQEKMPLWSISTFGNAFISLFVFPNTLWVSAVAVASLLATARDRQTSTETAADAEKKHQ